MQESQDRELLRQYARDNSDEAFAELVSRHVNMAYSAALRKTGNHSAAEDKGTICPVDRTRLRR